MMRPFTGLLSGLLTLAALAAPALTQTVTVTTAADVVDINWQVATIADLPGPDGKISFSEALIATNNTPGHQTIGFAIPQNEWILQFVLPGRAVLNSVTGFFFRATDQVTIDGTTQTAFTGDTHPTGNEVAIYGNTLYLNADGCTLIGFDTTSVSVNGSGCLVQGNTGSMNIDVFGGSGSLIEGNQASTIKLDRSSDNVVVGNTMSRVRVLGGGPDAANNRIGGAALADRNWITGYGTWNSDGYPGGSAVQIFATVGTVIENNWIGTTPDGLAIGNLACTEGIAIQAENHGVLIKDNRIAGIKGLGMGPHASGLLFGRGMLISGIGSGLSIVGNTLGLDANGAAVLGSVTGIDLGDPVTHPLSMTGVVVGGALPGQGNEIAGHILNGVLVGRKTQDVRLAGNSIHDNGWRGIDLVANTPSGYGVTLNDPLDADTGGNGLQNFPEISAVLRVGMALRLIGKLHSSASGAFTLEFFASPACDASGYGEGSLPLGTLAVSTNAQGNAAFDVTLASGAPEGWVVSATATREPLGATSEFSACVATVWRDELHALGGVGGDPLLTGQGDLTAHSGNSVTLGQAAPGALAGLFLALSGNPVPFKGGVLLPVPPMAPPLLATTGADGALVLPFVMPNGVPSGTELWLQWAIQDAAAVKGVALSNALVGHTP